ncbi:hypothetical protein Mapa_016513 [Marchantia paleacea]|nr:hypothetical protein Mapa_016513 [Marchantia paleacea]
MSNKIGGRFLLTRGTRVLTGCRLIRESEHFVTILVDAQRLGILQEGNPNIISQGGLSGQNEERLIRSTGWDFRAAINNGSTVILAVLIVDLEDPVLRRSNVVENHRELARVCGILERLALDGDKATDISRPLVSEGGSRIHCPIHSGFDRGCLPWDTLLQVLDQSHCSEQLLRQLLRGFDVVQFTRNGGDVLPGCCDGCQLLRDDCVHNTCVDLSCHFRELSYSICSFAVSLTQLRIQQLHLTNIFGQRVQSGIDSPQCRLDHGFCLEQSRRVFRIALARVGGHFLDDGKTLRNRAYEDLRAYLPSSLTDLRCLR